MINDLGHTYNAGTSTVTGRWVGFTVVTAATINEIDYQPGYGATDDDLASAVLPAGFEFRGLIESIKLTSGSIILWKK